MASVAPDATATYDPYVIKSLRARRSQLAGAQAQRLVCRLMQIRGFKCVAEIPTRMRRMGKQWVFAEKADGDIRAVGDGGRSVLVECKYRDHRHGSSGHLVWSDLAAHQSHSLTMHERAGGQSLLAWISGGKAQLLSWAALLQDGFGPGQSIDDDRCNRCAI